MCDHGDLADHHQRWINEALKRDFDRRDSKWTESIAVGNTMFVEQTKERLGLRAKGRKIEGYELRETNRGYVFTGKHAPLSCENTYLWNDDV